MLAQERLTETSLLDTLETKEVVESIEPSTQFSPSNIETLYKILKMPNLDLRNPDPEMLRPTRNEVIGSLKGWEGHLISAVVSKLISHHQAVSFAKCTPLVRFPRVLTPKAMKKREEPIFASIVDTVRKNHRLYELQEVPQIVREIRFLWREKINFAGKKGNSKNIKEGWGYSVEDMKEMWGNYEKDEKGQDHEMITFGERIIQIYESKIKSRDLPRESRNSSIYINEFRKAYKVQFPFCTICFTSSADFLIFHESDTLEIVDDKFSPWGDDSKAKKMQRLIYLTAADLFRQNWFKKKSMVLPYQSMGPGIVKFSYRNFDTQNLPSTYSYESGDLREDEILELLEELNHVVTL